MTHYSTEPRSREYVEHNGFLSFPRNLSNKYGTKLLDTATRTGLDAANPASKEVVNKVAETTDRVPSQLMK